MSLELDARQRAMLQEMGITVWAPAPAPAMPPAAAPVPPEPAASPAAPRTPVHAGATPTQAAPEPAPPPLAPTPPSAPLLHAPQALYPQADPAATPPELGPCWLIVVESATPHQPLSGDAGQLLDNMLRAMRLHRHPRAFVAPVARAAAGLPDEGAPPLPGPQVLETLRPAMVLALGLGAARAVLGSREPLGRLRAAVHRLADGTPDGIPVVVSHDPAYLLRAPDAKAAAWADLCRALALARPAT